MNKWELSWNRLCYNMELNWDRCRFLCNTLVHFNQLVIILCKWQFTVAYYFWDNKIVAYNFCIGTVVSSLRQHTFLFTFILTGLQFVIFFMLICRNLISRRSRFNYQILWLRWAKVSGRAAQSQKFILQKWSIWWRAPNLISQHHLVSPSGRYSFGWWNSSTGPS